MAVEGATSGPGNDLGAQEPTLRVRLLGGLDVRLGDVPVPPLDSARAESLLAYLLLHRDAPQARQHLAFMLWPDSTDSQARTNLRHVLHNLRRALPEAERFPAECPPLQLATDPVEQGNYVVHDSGPLISGGSAAPRDRGRRNEQP